MRCNILISSSVLFAVAFPCLVVIANNSISSNEDLMLSHQNYLLQRQILSNCYENVFDNDIDNDVDDNGSIKFIRQPRSSSRRLNDDGHNSNKCNGKIDGDGKIRTWSGLIWDYINYGNKCKDSSCDLIALRNPLFDNGKGIEVQVRTKRVYHYTYANDIAIKVGNDIFQVHGMQNDDQQQQYSLNGIPGDFSNNTTKVDKMDGKYQLSHWHSGNYDEHNIFNRHYLQLGETGEGIDVNIFENNFYLGIHAGISNVFQGSTGLFGDYDTGYLLGRDGETIFEPDDDFITEWQVRDDTDESLLLSTTTSNHHPDDKQQQQQIPKFVPSQSGEQHALAQAEELCADWGDDIDNCVLDIIASKMN